MRILLVQPNSPELMVGFTSMVRPEPLALESIGASVPEHEVKLLDMRIDPELEGTLSSFLPDLVGITGYTTDVPRIREICAQIKARDPQITTVVGGYHATLCPEDFDGEEIDYIVVGEGELTFRELVTTLEKGGDVDYVFGLIYRRQGRQVRTLPRAPARRLDSLPLPQRHLADAYRSHYHFHFWENPYLVETARGCPYRCSFCAVWRFHQGLCRTRKPEKVVEDLKSIPSPVVCFVDDNFLQNLRRSERLYDLIRAEGLKGCYWAQARSDSIVRRPDLIKKWSEIGLSAVLVGLEKVRQEDLASVNKRNSIKTNEKAMEILQYYGVDIWGSFIVDPSWTEAEFDDLIDYVRKWRISFPTFTILTPIPGTAFYQEKRHELTTSNYQLFDFLHAVLPTRLPLQDFYANMARLYASTTLGLKELKHRVNAGQIPHSALTRVREILRDVTNPQAYLKYAVAH